MDLPSFSFSSTAEIYQYRVQMGLRQDQFWARVGVTQSVGSRYESGDHAIPLPVQILLTIAYGEPPQSDAMTAAVRSWKNEPVKTTQSNGGAIPRSKPDRRLDRDLATYTKRAGSRSRDLGR